MLVFGGTALQGAKIWVPSFFCLLSFNELSAIKSIVLFVKLWVFRTPHPVPKNKKKYLLSEIILKFTFISISKYEI